MPLLRDRVTVPVTTAFTRVALVTSSASERRVIMAKLSDAATHWDVLRSGPDLFDVEQLPDLLILDRMRITTDFARLVCRIRQRYPTMTVVVYNIAGETAAAELLDAGADDAIPATANPAYVIARLRAAVRRMRTANVSVRRCVGDLIYDQDNRRLWCRGLEVALSRREAAVFDALWGSAGEVSSYDAIFARAWPADARVSARGRVEVYVCLLRRRLRASRASRIETVRGVGYRLMAIS
jgi:DNA-binding response OmpR family regulator